MLCYWGRGNIFIDACLGWYHNYLSHSPSLTNKNLLPHKNILLSCLLFLVLTSSSSSYTQEIDLTSYTRARNFVLIYLTTESKKNFRRLLLMTGWLLFSMSKQILTTKQLLAMEHENKIKKYSWMQKKKICYLVPSERFITTSLCDMLKLLLALTHNGKKILKVSSIMFYSLLLVASASLIFLHLLHPAIINTMHTITEFQK